MFSRITTPMAMALILIAALATASVAGDKPSKGKQPNGKDTVRAVAAMHKVVLTGFTRPRTIISLESEEDGKCLRVTADVGQAVAGSGVLVVLDPVYVNLDLKRTRADQKRLKAEVDYYEKELGRYKTLVESQTAAQTDLDNMIQRYTKAMEELNGLEVHELILKEQLRRHTITAPPGWKVIERHAEPGELISVGEKVAVLGDFRTLLVPFALTSTEYKTLRAIKNITLNLPDDGRRVPARIELVNPDFDPETRKIEVSLEVAKGMPEMRGGIRCELTLDTPDPSGAVLLPSGAVKERFDEYWVVREDGERVRVTRSGFGPDETVKIYSPKVKPGQRFETNPVF